MKRAYIGYGALGRQLKTLLDQTLAPPDAELYFDDVAFAAGQTNAFPFQHYTDADFVVADFYIGIGYKHPGVRGDIYERLSAAGLKSPRYIHPSGFVNPTAVIGKAAVIYPGCNIDQGVKIGNAVFLNNSVTISHDSEVGDYTFIAPGVVISGDVHIGKRCFIGAGAVIANGVRIGDDAIIGIGTVVTGDVRAGSSVIGNPMRVLAKKIELR